jgi:hypothetical protein
MELRNNRTRLSVCVIQVTRLSHVLDLNCTRREPQNQVVYRGTIDSYLVGPTYT